MLDDAYEAFIWLLCDSNLFVSGSCDTEEPDSDASESGSSGRGRAMSPIVRYYDPCNPQICSESDEETFRSQVQTPEFCDYVGKVILVEKQGRLINERDRDECLRAGLKGIIAKIPMAQQVFSLPLCCIQCKQKFSATYVVVCLSCRHLMHASCCNHIFETLPLPIKDEDGRSLLDDNGQSVCAYVCSNCTNPLVPEYVAFVPEN